MIIYILIIFFFTIYIILYEKKKNHLFYYYTVSNASSSTNESINDSWESLVDTTLSYLMLLLPFISFSLFSRGESRTVQIAESIGFYCYVTRLFYIYIYIRIYFIIFIIYI